MAAAQAGHVTPCQCVLVVVVQVCPGSAAYSASPALRAPLAPPDSPEPWVSRASSAIRAWKGSPGHPELPDSPDSKVPGGLLLAPHDVSSAACCWRRSVMCVSVCLLDSTVSPAKMVEPIHMPFGFWSRVGPMNHVLIGGTDPTGEGATLGVVPQLKRIRLCKQQTPGAPRVADLSIGSCR